MRPVPWNPRSISDERFQNLCRSIDQDTEFIWRRPVLAQADGTIYAGNMRHRAAQHLGHETISAIVATPKEHPRCDVRRYRHEGNNAAAAGVA